MGILNNIKKNKNLIIVGRGPTSRYLRKKNKDDFIIGYNIKSVNNLKFDACFIKNQIISLHKHQDKISLKKFNQYKVGSISFGLLNLLFFFEKLNIEKKITLYGFDFKKFSSDDDILKEKRLKNDLDGIQELIDINSQKVLFDIFKKKFQKLKIIKYGYDILSDNNNINNKNNNLEIIAEFTTNHQGNTNRLIELMESCIKANCRTIKFQKRDVERFYSKKELSKKYITPISNNFYEYRKKLELTDEQLEIIKSYSKKNDLKIIFSALDFKSYNDLRMKNFNYFKIPSTISLNKNFINIMAKQKLDQIYVSTGMTTQNYVDYIISKFKNKKLVLMHAISSYPTHFRNMNLSIINNYKKLSENNNNIIPGYSSHDVGDEGSMLAIAAGARVIEKHIKIGHTEWMHFDDTAIDARTELPIFIEKLNKTMSAMGSDKKKIYPFEHHKYKKTK